MSDLSLISQKFNVTTENLVSFNKTLDTLRQNPEISNLELSQKKLLNILNPLVALIDGKNTNKLTVDLRSIVDILHQQHDENWLQFVSEFKQLINKLNSESTSTLSDNDLNILDDVADAIDAECAYLFRRISSRL